ncbi:MAG: YabP/YqfC family sporulation protein [Peptostreptococcales bacterium]
MAIDSDLMFDFSLNIPRIIISGKYAIIDNVKSIQSFTNQGIVIDTGKQYTVVNGENFILKNLNDDRIFLTGKIDSVEFFYGNKKGD